MRISVQTAGITNRFGIDEGFRMIRKAGFEAVDINLDLFLSYRQIVAGHIYDFFGQPDAAILATCATYKAAAEANGIGFTQAHAPFPNRVRDEAVNAGVLKAVEKTIMMCGCLGVPRLVVHPGFFPYPEISEDDWEWNRRMYSALIPTLREHGVMCCLENMFTSNGRKIMCGPCASPGEANAWIDALNDIAGERLFGFCLDVGHAQLVGRDIYPFVRELGANLACLHVHDNDGESDEHMFPYTGMMDWERFCMALRDANYRGDLSLETFHSMEMVPRELGQDALNFAGAVARYLRRCALENPAG